MLGKINPDLRGIGGRGGRKSENGRQMKKLGGGGEIMFCFVVNPCTGVCMRPANKKVGTILVPIFMTMIKFKDIIKKVDSIV